MSANFKQPALNIREMLNKLMFHRHDELYEKKGTFVGKNLLINGDKSISQLGDFSTPFVPVSYYNYVDAYSCVFQSANVTPQYSHVAYNPDIESRSLLVEITATNGSVLSGVASRQYVRVLDQVLGKVVTYSAYVKSNTNATLALIQNLGGGLYAVINSTPHSGTGEWELLTATFQVNTAATYLETTVNMGPQGQGTTVGEYFEVGNEQFEVGNAFTGFEYVLPAIQINNCRNELLPLTSAGVYDFIGLFVSNTTTNMQCTLNLTPQQGNTSASLLNGSTVIVIRNGPQTGTITQGTLRVDSTLTDMELGKLSLYMTGTGFAVGELNYVFKNNDATIVAVR